MNLNHEESYDGDNRNQLFSTDELNGAGAEHKALDNKRDSIKTQ